jgi:hypothetical protein
MSREDLLNRLLAALVHEWGVSRVQQALAAIEPKVATRPQNTSSTRDTASSPRRKPTAVDLALKVRGPADLRRAVEELAALFDEKLFLHSVGDVRLFMEMRGKELSTAVSRSEAFGKVLEELVEMPVEQLRDLVQVADLSGPSQLAPLSHAIRNASAALRPTVRHDGDDIKPPKAD